MDENEKFNEEIQGLLRDHKRSQRIVKIAFQALLTIGKTTDDEAIREYSAAKIKEIIPIMQESINDR